MDKNPEELIDKAALEAAVEGQESTQPEVTPQEPELSDVEKEALTHGWTPKDQWKGDPDSWRSAKEFVERHSLFRRIKQYGDELSQVKQALNYMTEQNKRQYAQGFQNAIKEMIARRNAALEEGELVKAQELSDKIADYKQNFKEVQASIQAPAVPEPTDTFKEWASRNSWYGQDRSMTKYADAEGMAFKEANPMASEADCLRHVESVIKEEYAHRLNKKSAPVAAPQPDGEGRVAPRRTPSSTPSYATAKASMTEEQKAIMKTIIKTTGMTEQEYFKQYLS